MANALEKQPNSDLAELQNKAAEFAENALADNTLVAYASDRKHFVEWCDIQGLEHIPAEQNTIIAYITFMAGEGYKVSTIERRLAAIRKAHEARGIDGPTGMLAVRTVMKGIRKSLGVAPTKKEAITTEHIVQWIETLGTDEKSLRDKAIILIGYAGALRRSEITGLDVEDLKFSSKGVLLTLRRSKTDQEGAGQHIAIPHGENRATDPVRALRAWLKTSKIRSGPVFRGFTPPSLKGGRRIRETRLSARFVAVLVKDLCEAIGIDPAKCGGHSLRAGHATQADRNNAPRGALKRQGRWQNERTIDGYIRENDLFRDNSASYLGL